MRLKDFNYLLPKKLIAQMPVSPRDQSWLLVLDRLSGRIRHEHFYDIVKYLNKGDVLVLNNTKVMSARLIGKRAETGGKVEVFLLTKIKTNVWQCLVGGKKRKDGLRVKFSNGLKAEILKNNQDGTWQVKFNKSGAEFMRLAEKIGRVPLPPYIKRSAAFGDPADRKTYQTVYADAKKSGSVAAPTAGLHFTPALLKKIKQLGVQIEYVTLRVGLGTFAPVKADDITKHRMHAEWLEIDKKTLANIARARAEGRRVVAVGTTSVRTLESVFSKKKLGNYKGWTDIFIYPGYKFKAIDAMITNFHLPKSTLLMLAAAFAGRVKILRAYRQAIKKRYRFYSYGDAMLII